KSQQPRIYSRIQDQIPENSQKPIHVSRRSSQDSLNSQDSQDSQPEGHNNIRFRQPSRQRCSGARFALVRSPPWTGESIDCSLTRTSWSCASAGELVETTQTCFVPPSIRNAEPSPSISTKSASSISVS